MAEAGLIDKTEALREGIQSESRDEVKEARRGQVKAR